MKAHSNLLRPHLGTIRERFKQVGFATVLMPVEPSTSTFDGYAMRHWPPLEPHDAWVDPSGEPFGDGRGPYLRISAPGGSAHRIRTRFDTVRSVRIDGERVFVTSWMVGLIGGRWHWSIHLAPTRPERRSR